jgi:hypothetical protein
MDEAKRNLDTIAGPDFSFSALAVKTAVKALLRYHLDAPDLC